MLYVFQTTLFIFLRKSFIKQKLMNKQQTKIQAIAKELGISPKTLKKWLKKAAIKTTKKRDT